MFEQLKGMICEFVEVDENQIGMESRFIEDLGFNSYDLMCLVGEIEEYYDVEIEERDVVNLRTVREVIDYMSAQVA